MNHIIKFFKSSKNLDDILYLCKRNPDYLKMHFEEYIQSVGIVNDDLLVKMLISYSDKADWTEIKKELEG